MSNASFTKLSVSFDLLVYKKNKVHRSIFSFTNKIGPKFNDLFIVSLCFHNLISLYFAE